MKTILIDKNIYQLSASDLKKIIVNSDLPQPIVKEISKNINLKMIFPNTITSAFIYLLTIISIYLVFNDKYKGKLIELILPIYLVISTFFPKLIRKLTPSVVTYITRIETTYNLKFKQEDDII